jgi:hypothetical protein
MIEKPYFTFDLDNNSILFCGEYIATGDDFFLDSINNLIKILQKNKNERIIATFKNTYLKDDVFSVLIFHLIGEIIDQKINLQILWYYDNERSLEAGKELREIFDCDFNFIESK